jgi:hypothetical protein
METLDKNKLIAAAENLIDKELTKGWNPNWEVIQNIVQDFTDVKGNKLTLTVSIKPFDTRSMDIE